MCTRLASALALAMLAPVAACDDTLISISSDGRIEIAINTTGGDVVADGFSVTIDGGVAEFVPAGQAVTLTNLRAGSHTVRLLGLAPECRVEGPNPRSVVVGAGPDDAVQVEFMVRCARAAAAASEAR
jgi:hypothetical protein